MGVSKAALEQITGLSNSGSTGSGGTWNEDVDLDNTATAPAGATGAILRIINTSSSQRWAGVREPAKTTAHYQEDQLGRETKTIISPMGTGNTIDIYVENTSDVLFFVIGYVDWTFFDIDSTLPTLPSTGSTLSTVTAPSEVPAGTSGILMRDFNQQWCPQEESTVYSDNIGGFGNILKLDGSKQVKIDTGTTYDILGHFPADDVTWLTWLSNESPTFDSTWNNGATTWSGEDAMFGIIDKGSTATYFTTRPEGSAFNTISVSQFDACMWTPLGSLGDYEYNAETGGSGSFYPIATFSAISAGGGGGLSIPVAMRHYMQMKKR